MDIGCHEVRGDQYLEIFDFQIFDIWEYLISRNSCPIFEFQIQIFGIFDIWKYLIFRGKRPKSTKPPKSKGGVDFAI